MTRKDGVLVKGFIVFIFLLLLGFAVTIYTKQPTLPPVKAVAITTPATILRDIHSSNADKKLMLRTTSIKDGGAIYTFSTADISGANQRTIFTKTLPVGSSMSIPFNAWDPTDTYVFLEEKDAGAPNYFVIKSAGGPVIDAGAVWKEKKIPYTIREATGWASGTLLIIYTQKDDGSKGPAFWFEIPSTAIIQLAG